MAVDTIVKTLVDLQLVRLVGRSELPGHPFLYGTTPLFLEHFGLASLSELNAIDPTLQRSNPRERAKLFVKKEKPKDEAPTLEIPENPESPENLESPEIPDNPEISEEPLTVARIGSTGVGDDDDDIFIDDTPDEFDDDDDDDDEEDFEDEEEELDDDDETEEEEDDDEDS